VTGTPRRPTFVSIAYTHAPRDPRVRRECESLERAGWRVVQIGLSAPGDPPVSHLNGVAYIHVPQGRYRGGALLRYVRAYLGFFIRSRRIVVRLLRRGTVDVVQVTNLPNSLVWAAAPARGAGAGVLLDMRDPVPEFFQCKFGDRFYGPLGTWCAELEERVAAMGADLVVTANEPHRLVSEAHGVPAAKLRIVLNTADATHFPMTPPRAANPLVAYSGTVAGRMGLDVILGSLRMLRDEGVPAEALILGDGDAVPALQAVRDRLGLTDAVTLTGERFRVEELGARLAGVGIGLVPLRRDAFTDLLLSMKLLEYVRLGIPAIVIRTPTLAHYFPDDTVTFVDELTPEAWAGAIRRVLADPEAARARASRAQKLPIAEAWQASERDFVALAEEASRLGMAASGGGDGPVKLSAPEALHPSATLAPGAS
jgi:glycosyltransferase involved in cell wall biosynthesis